MSHNRPREILLVFIKYPQSGHVKTRLIPSVGARAAATIYRRLAETLVTRVRGLQRPGLVGLFFVDPPERLSECARWLDAPECTFLPQCDGDLGARMRDAFSQAFDRGADRVIIIGTDCPELDGSRIDAAFEALRNHDAVLGPALDGGYYLLGLNYALPQVFEGVPWSSSRTARETRRRLEEARCWVAELPILRDLDTPEDLELLRQSWPTLFA